MPTVRRSADVKWSAQQMYALVNDVESYPQFLHWCSGARVISTNAGEMVAEVNVGLAGIRQSFSTRNTLDPPGRIDIELLKGPFRRLDGRWRFTDTDAGCTVDLEIDFAVSMSPLGFVLARLFEEIARSQMDAFVLRAQTVYGKA